MTTTFKIGDRVRLNHNLKPWDFPVEHRHAVRIGLAEALRAVWVVVEVFPQGDYGIEPENDGEVGKYNAVRELIFTDDELLPAKRNDVVLEVDRV